LLRGTDLLQPFCPTTRRCAGCGKPKGAVHLGNLAAAARKAQMPQTREEWAEAEMAAENSPNCDGCSDDECEDCGPKLLVVKKADDFLKKAVLDAPKCEDCLRSALHEGETEVPAAFQAFLKDARYGLPLEGKRRWCAGCAKEHTGAVNVKKTVAPCEDCGLKESSHGLAKEWKKRWCADCAAAAGAVDEGGRAIVPHPAPFSISGISAEWRESMAEHDAFGVFRTSVPPSRKDWGFPFKLPRRGPVISKHIGE
jgi:hypothetical protein